LIITTTDRIEGKRVVKVHGLAMANSVRARHVGRDIMAALRNLVGGEVAEYSKLLADSRELAIQRMIERAEGMGANAVVGTRFITAGIMGGASEILAYGTAVEVEDEG
jgi:uncharacterized protein YbjQ (UPF0145 family)